MDSMEGMLLIPPDRGQILGRAVWKPRYVVVGRRSAPKQEQQTGHSLAQVMNSSRSQLQASTSRTANNPPTLGEYAIAVYKNKDEGEPGYVFPLSTVVDCKVEQVSHRKQGPILPTLVVTINNDKERKRRSSRAAGFMSSKEASSSTLWFRIPPDDHHQSLNDWARFILSRKVPLSPDSPSSPSFINPFGTRPQGNEYFSRPTSGNAPSNSRSTLLHKSSTATSGRDRPVTFSSASTSLRSKRSDISSPSSATHHSGMTHAMPDLNKYTTVLPTDIPSPVATVGDYKQGELIEGWTSAQGRTSTISSPVRTRGSVSSHTQQGQGGATPASSSPPVPRETILDRAFQMRYIPGSEVEVPGEDKLTSLARFEALMRESDDKRREQQRQAQAERAATIQSAWDADDSSDNDDDDDDVLPNNDNERPTARKTLVPEENEADEDDLGLESDDSDDYADEAEENNRQTLIPPNARKALAFLANRHDESPPTSPREAALRQSTGGFIGGSPSTAALAAPSRPHTAHSRVRPTPTTRTHSQPQLAPVPRDRLDALTASTGKPSEEEERHAPPSPAVAAPILSPSSSSSSSRTTGGGGSSGNAAGGGEKRLSTASSSTAGATKRLSFTEFTKRLSSTSSLLVVQTNASGGSSSRESNEFDRNPSPAPRGISSSARVTGVHPPPRPSRDPEREEWERRCGFRPPGVGFVEGGFL